MAKQCLIYLIIIGKEYKYKNIVGLDSLLCRVGNHLLVVIDYYLTC